MNNLSKKATVIAVVNQKGGTGKTTTTENLGIGLARKIALICKYFLKSVPTVRGVRTKSTSCVANFAIE